MGTGKDDPRQGDDFFFSVKSGHDSTLAKKNSQIRLILLADEYCRRSHLFLEGPDQGVVFIQNGEVPLSLVEKDSTLKMSVLSETVVAIKMIGGDIENAGDKRMKFLNSF